MGGSCQIVILQMCIRDRLGNRQKRNRLTGHFVGLYAEGGIYDFQWKGDGYRGDYYGAAGVTYGLSLIHIYWMVKIDIAICSSVYSGIEYLDVWLS